MRSVLFLVLLAQVALVASAAAQSPKTPQLDVNGDQLADGAVARLGTLRFQPPGYVRGIALSPDGMTVATVTRDKEGSHVDFMDISTGKSLRKLDLADIACEQIQFSFDLHFLTKSEFLI